MLGNKILICVVALALTLGAFGAENRDELAPESVQNQAANEDCTCTTEALVANEYLESVVKVVKFVKGKRPLVKKAPGKKSPVKKAPSKKPPVKKAPGKKSPVKKTPGKNPRPVPTPPQPQPPPVPQPPPPPSGSMRVMFIGNVWDFAFNPVGGTEIHIFANDQFVSKTTTDSQGDFLIEWTEGSDVVWRICARNVGDRGFYSCFNVDVPFQDGAERDVRLQFTIDPTYRVAP